MGEGRDKTRILRASDAGGGASAICVTEHHLHYFPSPLPLSSNLFQDLNLTLTHLNTFIWK